MARTPGLTTSDGYETCCVTTVITLKPSVKLARVQQLWAALGNRRKRGRSRVLRGSSEQREGSSGRSQDPDEMRIQPSDI